MDWFLYDRDLRHERIKTIAEKTVERVDHIHSINTFMHNVEKCSNIL